MDLKKLRKPVAEIAGEIHTSAVQGVQKVTSSASDKVKKGVDKSTKMVNKVMDVNGDGQVDIEDIIIMSLKIPGICIDREQFLRSEFRKEFPAEIIEDAINFNPAHAGITQDKIEKYADEVIKFERNCVTGISAALSTPGGFTMAATIPADIAQYYGYMMRVAQKLLYLYGFPQIDVTEKGKKFDTETLNILTLCLGVMYGVAGANNALKAVAKALGSGVQKQLMKKALTKGTIYPIVRNIAKWFGVRMTKEVFTGFFKHAIPVAGGVIGGGLTYMSFKPCCDKLKNSLKDTLLSNPDAEKTEEKNEIVIDIEEIEDVKDTECQ
ncbi:MAG TPA: EcsC family protein [Candidatus Mediterraneibacter norfolkensis]|nr:EcsC family protein [Candidatus Mediterraneibacter norfolkensis]